MNDCMFVHEMMLLNIFYLQFLLWWGRFFRLITFKDSLHLVPHNLGQEAETGGHIRTVLDYPVPLHCYLTTTTAAQCSTQAGPSPDLPLPSTIVVYTCTLYNVQVYSDGGTPEQVTTVYTAQILHIEGEFHLFLLLVFSHLIFLLNHSS